jgi:glycosyltransferase involved in cell wall biosynthesis
MKMSKSRVRVSIVIPAHNEERHLRFCLEAIASQTVAPYEVIVVDNNSTDNTASVAGEFPFASVVREFKQGIVFARNAGFDAAKGDVIGRIDADIQLPKDWVAHVSSFYADKEHAGAAWTGMGYFYNMPFPRFVSWSYGIIAFGFNKFLLGHYTLWGSNMAITKQQWLAVRRNICKRNDIHEDLDLAIHIDEAGYNISYDTTIKTNAELRRVQSDRSELWSYLQWWPTTLRIHGKKSWPLVWYFGAFNLYLISFAFLLIGKVTQRR